MTAHRVDPWIRRLRYAAVLALFVLTACGPGSGGTGVGPIQPKLAFGSSGITPSAPVGVTIGPAHSASADCTSQPQCAEATLRLEDTRISLTAACLRFAFEGLWSIDANGRLSVPGTMDLFGSTGTTTGKVTLTLLFSELEVSSSQVTVTLTDAAGKPAFGPKVLNRNDAATEIALANCTSR